MPEAHRRTPHRWRRIAASLAIVGAVLAPTMAFADHSFGDVPDANVFHDDIDWLVGAGVTQGCGDGTNYCPGDAVTREQMAAFMHRLSGNAPGVAPSVDADTVDGFDAADLMAGGGPPGPAGPPGPGGPAGPAGPAGPPGPAADSSVEATAQLNNDTFENVVADCPAGTTAIAGGYQIQASQGGALSSDWYAAADRPTQARDGWVASLRTIDDAPHDAFVTIYVTCVPS